jgi:hypothetical protein
MSACDPKADMSLVKIPQCGGLLAHRGLLSSGWQYRRGRQRRTSIQNDSGLSQGRRGAFAGTLDPSIGPRSSN